MTVRRKKTILVFDCWLPGFSYIKELADYAEISLVFVHTSSLQIGDPAKEYEAFKQQFNVPGWVHDFSEYRYDFRELFERVKPEAVLVLSLHHIESRTALMFAKEFGIQTYLVPHGIFYLFEERPTDNATKNNINFVSFIISKLPRVVYYTKFFWKFHIQRMRYGASRTRGMVALRCYVELISRYFYWQWRPSRSVQSYYDALIGDMIIYDNALHNYYGLHYGQMVQGARVAISGTLDMGRVARHLRSRNASEGPRWPGRCAYYISSPYTEYFTRENTAIYADVVRKLRDFVVAAGYDTFVYRPHPGEPAEFTRNVCELAGAHIDYERDLAGLVDSELICGTGSSLLYCAVVLRKPIVILDTQRLKVDLPYYEPLTSYPTILFDADAQDNSASLEVLSTRTMKSELVDISDIRDPLTDLVGMITRQGEAGA